MLATRLFAAGMLLATAGSALAAIHYVDVNNSSPTPPYTNWTTAATTIQDAVDAAVAGDQILVTNGVYQIGARGVSDSTNRVAVTNEIAVRSVNGAAVTVIHGQDAVRCVYLANGAALVGFTLTNGGAEGGDYTGGGVWCESASAVVSNCVLTSNGAFAGGGAAGGTLINCTLSGNSTDLLDGAGGGAYRSTLNSCVLNRNVSTYGGGAYDCTLNNCTLKNNSADRGGWKIGGGAADSTLNNCTLTGNSGGDGGGVAGGTLNNCTLTGNAAFVGGGATGCTLNNCTLTANTATTGGGGASGSGVNNCIVYYNSAPNGSNADNYSYLSYCCTTPLPTNGIANITNAPLFVDYAGRDLCLQSNSPCINAGANAFAPAGPDLDGNPRIAGGTVDIGAYEVQSPQSRISYAWLQQYGLPSDGSADFTDPDGDGMNNWQEWWAGTDPTNALSALRLLSPAPGAPGVIVGWQSVAGRNYFLERGTDLRAQPTFLPLATDIIGQPGTTTFKDTNVVGAGPVFYRVGVQD